MPTPYRNQRARSDLEKQAIKLGEYFESRRDRHFTLPENRKVLELEHLLGTEGFKPAYHFWFYEAVFSDDGGHWKARNFTFYGCGKRPGRLVLTQKVLSAETPFEIETEQLEQPEATIRFEIYTEKDGTDHLKTAKRYWWNPRRHFWPLSPFGVYGGAALRRIRLAQETAGPSSVMSIPDILLRAFQ
ncbi:hypothetical protein KY362_02880 [Candidatus Woesearchaeota archaeon]|nr:hypothetical protein [Candidatus Woesearchaeota archaeon]